jgi:catecholate siderophore receptor
VGQAISENFAARLMGFFQNSDSYRDDVHLRRTAINPTVSFRAGDRTRVRVSFEHARDERTADRGIPSFGGRPLRTGTSTFFGDPARSNSESTVNALVVFAEHRFGSGVLLRNHFRFADYDKFYQNVFPGAVNAAGTAVAINAYSNATRRENLINQTDLLLDFRTGPVEHRLLAGVELSRQYTENRRLTGYFGGPTSNVTSVQASLASPRVTAPIFFRPSATDADNSGTATGAALLLQDQIRLLPSLQLIAGLRVERFEVDFRNRRTGEELKVTDTAVSPRIGLVWRPVEPLSLYASYSNSYLPRAGEQLASLTLNTRNLQPERFTNTEVGAKWDVLPELSVTAAIFQIDRTNVAVTDPADVSRSVLVDGTRQRGFELGVRGRVSDRWSVLGGWAFQEGEITSRQSATVAKGNTVPFLSRNAVSLWNRIEVTPTLGVGVGVIHQSSYFAATDNLVRIPGFTRLDAALFWRATERVGVQANFENLLGTKYYPEAHSNNNITPGAPFAMRFALTANF